MSRIGYARVSSTGQSLDVQTDKLIRAKCDRIYEEKCSGRTADRPAFKDCSNYLREGDVLIVTRLDRLARSVVHLAQLAERFEKEKVDLVVLDQSIDTSTPTGRLLFNMLAAISEFENDLRQERVAEGIAKAKQNGVRFGRPPKLTEARKQEIYTRHLAGARAWQLAQEFNLGEATVYRALREVKKAGNLPEKRTTKILLWLQFENNSKFVRGKGKSRKEIEDHYLPRYKARKLHKNGWEYELTFEYRDDEDLEEQVNTLAAEMNQVADTRHGFVECEFLEVGTERLNRPGFTGERFGQGLHPEVQRLDRTNWIRWKCISAKITGNQIQGRILRVIFG